MSSDHSEGVARPSPTPLRDLVRRAEKLLEEFPRSQHAEWARGILDYQAAALADSTTGQLPDMTAEDAYERGRASGYLAGFKAATGPLDVERFERALAASDIRSETFYDMRRNLTEIAAAYARLTPPPPAGEDAS